MYVLFVCVRARDFPLKAIYVCVCVLYAYEIVCNIVYTTHHDDIIGCLIGQLVISDCLLAIRFLFA